jgi:hypothetical protein
VRRSKVENARIENTEDILASLARMRAELERCEQANDYIQKRLTDSRTRCAELQRQVVAMTGYEYGRERVAA